MRLETLDGAAARAVLPALARLRIAVFAEWPYLCDGDAAGGSLSGDPACRA